MKSSCDNPLLNADIRGLLLALVTALTGALGLIGVLSERMLGLLLVALAAAAIYNLSRSV